MVFLSFLGQGLLFPRKAKGSPESTERLTQASTLLNSEAEAWGALNTLPGVSHGYPRETAAVAATEKQEWGL